MRARGTAPHRSGLEEAATHPAPATRASAAFGPALAVVLAGVFVAMAVPVLDVLPHDFDEGWFMLDARFVARGERPFVDFPHHEMPLHLYLLALSGQVFGATIFGYRMSSLLSVAASGLAIFWLARAFVGTIPALLAEAVFLFSPVQSRALTAVPETPGLFLTLVGTALLFTRNDRGSAWVSGAAFVTALLVKPTYLVVAIAAGLALAGGRQWRRLGHFAAAGVVAAVVGLAWVVLQSDGVFADVVRFQLTKIGTHQGGMWTIDSGFTDMKSILRIETPRQWATINFQTFFLSRVEATPLALFALALLAIPLWVFGCARARPAFRVFVVLWPTSLLLLNFVLMDFVSPRYFIPFFAFTAFLFAGWVWLAATVAGARATAVAGVAAAVLLGGHFAATLGSDADPWFWGRTRAIAEEHPTVVSFSPLYFAATGTEPGCGFANSALTYGSFGENILASERVRPFRFSDERLIHCLRTHRDVAVVIDWAFYFFTRPGSPLREYLAGEGSAQRLFFSPDAVQQWDRPLLRMSPLR